MNPLSGGILSMPFSLLANILNKPVPRTSTVLSPEEQILMELESGTRFPKTDVPSPEEEILNELISSIGQNEKDRPISSPFKGYENGGGVGEAGRQYPPGTLMSPFMGDKAPIPKAWMQQATEPMPSPEEVAEFDRMIEMLQAKELLKKQMQKMQELGMFSDKEAIEYKEGDILPPWQGKRNFKGDLYEDNIELPVAREGYLQR